VVHRGNGVTLMVNAPAAATVNKYVQSLTVSNYLARSRSASNGATSTRGWLPESFVGSGGTLSYVLGSTPNPAWGSAPSDAPPSFDG
jgi:putative alpha-1,2-mannosidase